MRDMHTQPKDANIRLGYEAKMLLPLTQNDSAVSHFFSI